MPISHLSRVRILAPSRKEAGRLSRRHGFHAPGGWRRQADGRLFLEAYVPQRVLKALHKEDAVVEVLENATEKGLLRQKEVGQGNRYASQLVGRLSSEEGYLNVDEVEAAVQQLATSFPTLTRLVALPHSTYKGRTCHALRVGAHLDGTRPALVVLGGVHAREWGSCEIALNLAAELLNARSNGTGYAQGSYSLTAAQVQALLEGVEIVVFPCVNPDGRHYSQTRNPMWRKNRRPMKLTSGVDLNRNFDFLWDFEDLFSPDCLDAVATSNKPRNETYCGPSAFSEPETRNVRWLLDHLPHARWFVDLHSYGELILFNWGDDENQTTQPPMNFRNPAYDARRGLQGDASYREYIPPADQDAVRQGGERMQVAIAAVRGTSYTVQQSFELYPTSGTSDDYVYSRHLVDGSKSKVRTLCVEWGTEFQPPWTEMVRIIDDLTAGLAELAMVTLEEGI